VVVQEVKIPKSGEREDGKTSITWREDFDFTVHIFLA
jgi:hypothetical protein